MQPPSPTVPPFRASGSWIYTFFILSLLLVMFQCGAEENVRVSSARIPGNPSILTFPKSDSFGQLPIASYPNGNAQRLLRPCAGWHLQGCPVPASSCIS